MYNSGRGLISILSIRRHAHGLFLLLVLNEVEGILEADLCIRKKGLRLVFEVIRIHY